MESRFRGIFYADFPKTIAIAPVSQYNKDKIHAFMIKKRRFITMTETCDKLVSFPREETMLNVLTLGAKNDGSEDVSEIVNRYTADHALFFPAGKYKVSHPLKIKNPIYGVGYARSGAVDMAHTWLISDITHGVDDPAQREPFNEVGVIEFGGSGRFTVEDLNIVCRSYECAIYINPCVQATATFVNKVGMYAVRGYGICAAKDASAPGFASRPLFLQNLTILGTSDSPLPSVGIYMGERIGDNRLTNIEIMGTCVGIIQEASFAYGTNIHIWTGCLGHVGSDDWWSNTRGLVLGHAEFIGDNIYIDTSYIHVEFKSHGANLSINNFMEWEDGSNANCTWHSGKLFACAPGLKDAPCVNLNGGLVYVKGNDENPGQLSDLIAPGLNPRIQNVRILSDFAVNYKNYRRLCFSDFGTPSYNGQAGAGYTRIAGIVAGAENGSCEVVYTSDSGDRANITVEKLNGEIFVDAKKGRKCTPLYAKVEDNFVTLYAKNDGGTYSVSTVCASRELFPIDLGMIKNGARVQISEVRESADGLCEL